MNNYEKSYDKKYFRSVFILFRFSIVRTHPAQYNSHGWGHFNIISNHYEKIEAS